MLSDQRIDPWRVESRAKAIRQLCCGCDPLHWEVGVQCAEIDHDEISAVTHLISNLINAVGELVCRYGSAYQYGDRRWLIV